MRFKVGDIVIPDFSKTIENDKVHGKFKVLEVGHFTYKVESLDTKTTDFFWDYELDDYFLSELEFEAKKYNLL